MKGQLSIRYLIMMILTLVTLALVMSINRGFVIEIMEKMITVN